MFVSEEELLDRYLPEYSKLLLDLNHLQRVFPRRVNSSVLKCNCRECSSELICLMRGCHRLAFPVDRKPDKKPYPINQGPVPAFDQERELPEYAAKQSILKDESIGRVDFKTGREDSNLAFAPLLFDAQQRWGPRSRTQRPICV